MQFFRHGQRTPADTYPKDPYVNFTFEPYDWGQLTNVSRCARNGSFCTHFANLHFLPQKGKYSVYEQIGLWLRERYGRFVGATYRAKNVHVQTTGVSRTQMSMQLVLAGLFPPQGTALQWNRRLDWQPIPYFSEPLSQDTVSKLTVDGVCV